MPVVWYVKKAGISISLRFQPVTHVKSEKSVVLKFTFHNGDYFREMEYNNESKY